MEKGIKEWEKIFEIEVMDPDGFDRADMDLYKRVFTKEEFEKGLTLSTCMCKADNLDGSNPVIEIYKVNTDTGTWCAFDKIEDAVYMVKIETECKCDEVRLERSYIRKKTFDDLPEYEG